MKPFFTILLFLLISCQSGEQENDTQKKSHQDSNKQKTVDSVLTEKVINRGEEDMIFDTINQIPLRKKVNVKLYSGKTRDYLYCYNNSYTYGFKQDWQALKPISEKEYFASKKRIVMQVPDTVSWTVKKENGDLRLSDDFIFTDDTLEQNLAVHELLGCFFDKKICIISKQGIHKKNYFAFNHFTNHLDTLEGDPTQTGQYLLCADLELMTDSQHEIGIYTFKKDSLERVVRFSPQYAFGIRPEDVFLYGDSVVMFKQLGGNKYWALNYLNITDSLLMEYETSRLR